jgi:threonine aldolase
MSGLIDLRSDTVTLPTPSMREAMAAADVGDDVYAEDPTVNRLEERTARLMERDAALFVPSGTMGNQIAVHLLSSRGSEVIGETSCHIFNFEMGAMAALSGALPRPVSAPDGILDPEQIELAIRPAAGFRTPTSLVVLENTHNLAGGRVVPLDRMRQLVEVAKRHGLPVHLDGARIHNAAAALGETAAALADGCDTVMFCFSKGLAAPVGSVLVGDEDLIGEARRVRKLFGGGMRQAGILAAACLVALDEILPRLTDDHETARRLGRMLAEIPHIDLDPGTVDTNIVCFGVAQDSPLSAGELAERLADERVLVQALGHDSIRMVTHYHITPGDTDVAADAVCRLLSG